MIRPRALARAAGLVMLGLAVLALTTTTLLGLVEDAQRKRYLAPASWRSATAGSSTCECGAPTSRARRSSSTRRPACHPPLGRAGADRHDERERRRCARQFVGAGDLGDLPLLVVAAYGSASHYELQRDLATLSSNSHYVELDVWHTSMLFDVSHAALVADELRGFLSRSGEGR